MKYFADVLMTAQQSRPEQLDGSVAIIVDVLRATTTILTLLSRTIEVIYPAVTVEEAFSLKTRFPDSLLCGERNGEKVPGFDFGNSPSEFALADLAASKAVLTTTNGTLAVSKAATARCVFAGCLRNAAAVAKASVDAAERAPASSKTGGSSKVVIVCAGTGGFFSLDDFFAAGVMASAINRRGFELSDAAWAAARLAEQPVRAVVNAETCGHVRLLQSKGFGSDIDFAFDTDSESSVPKYDFEGGFFSL